MIDMKDMKDKKDDPNETVEQYSICCSNSSVGFIKYSSTLLFAFSIMVFSMVMIAMNPDRDNSIYFSLISGTLGLFTPQPVLLQKKD